ncbi:MAG: translation initiation factor IF-5A [Nanoarchaeota archaeon]
MDEKKLMAIGDLKPGSYIIIDGIACVVRDVQISKTGKHGSSKCRLEAVGIINGEKKVIVMPSHNNVEVPIIEKRTAQILSISGDTANVMDAESYETFDLKIPEDLKQNISEGRQVVYWIVMKEKIMKQLK